MSSLAQFISLTMSENGPDGTSMFHTTIVHCGVYGKDYYQPTILRLFSELSPFIPAEHYQEFEDYLQQHGIPLPENVSTISSTRSNHGYT